MFTFSYADWIGISWCSAHSVAQVLSFQKKTLKNQEFLHFCVFLDRLQGSLPAKITPCSTNVPFVSLLSTELPGCPRIPNRPRSRQHHAGLHSGRRGLMGDGHHHHHHHHHHHRHHHHHQQQQHHHQHISQTY